jgi:hypothetical protein
MMPEREPENEFAAKLTPPLDQIAGREFSFYPSVNGIEENLFRLLDADWTEFEVENVAAGTKFWMPRRFLGEVSATDKPVMIVGLNRTLEYKAGQVWPVQKRVIEMPRVPTGAPTMDAPLDAKAAGGLDGLSGKLRLDASEKKVGRLIVVSIVAAIVLVAVALAVFRGNRTGENLTYQTVVQENLGLGPDDDYYAVVRKLGTPREDRWKEPAETVQYRVLAYPERRLFVILAGGERKDARYVGALDGNWRVVDSVTQKGGSSTYTVLQRLRRF